MAEWFGKDVFKLGFGLMRLPKLEDGVSIDIPQVCKMVDLFIEAGGTYFDTAYVYDGGRSEEAAKAALVDRYPRDKFTLATKLNARVSTSEENAKQQLFTSLERTGAGYFDYYLLHAIGRGNIDTYNKYHIWDFVKEQKEAGLIRHWGFSFHADPELLDELLTKHPDVEFIQLQLNYADWDSEQVQSRKCWEVARKHGVSVTVMEPVKGGALANPIPAVQEIFKAADPDVSPASWAIRYVASLEGIITVLSGMSNVEQMEDNISFMKNFKPYTEDEYKVIEKVKEAMAAVPTIACTACHYCTDGCPMSIPIPEIFSVRNQQLVYNTIVRAKNDYARATSEKGKASDCIQCGQCEAACPQGLPIITLLQECAENLE